MYSMEQGTPNGTELHVMYTCVYVMYVMCTLTVDLYVTFELYEIDILLD